MVPKSGAKDGKNSGDKKIGQEERADDYGDFQRSPGRKPSFGNF